MKNGPGVVPAIAGYSIPLALVHLAQEPRLRHVHPNDAFLRVIAMSEVGIGRGIGRETRAILPLVPARGEIKKGQEVPLQKVRIVHRDGSRVLVAEPMQYSDWENLLWRALGKAEVLVT